MEKFKSFITKIIFGFPIAMFLGIGVFVVTDIIQPSYFKDIPSYAGYFATALIVGFLALLQASNLLTTLTNMNAAKKQNPFSWQVLGGILIFLCVEGLFSFLAVQSYYGDSKIPIAQILGICGIPFLFSFFYFPSLVLNTYQKYKPETKPFEVKSVKEIPPELFVEYKQLVERKKTIIKEKSEINV